MCTVHTPLFLFGLLGTLDYVPVWELKWFLFVIFHFSFLIHVITIMCFAIVIFNINILIQCTIPLLSGSSASRRGKNSFWEVCNKVTKLRSSLTLAFASTVLPFLILLSTSTRVMIGFPAPESTMATTTSVGTSSNVINSVPTSIRHSSKWFE